MLKFPCEGALQGTLTARFPHRLQLIAGGHGRGDQLMVKGPWSKVVNSFKVIVRNTSCRNPVPPSCSDRGRPNNETILMCPVSETSRVLQF